MSTESFTGGNDPDTEGRTLPPVRDDRMKAPDPDDTRRGRYASPADEQPPDQMPESDTSDPGVGPAHVTGTQRGEDLSDPG